jgi:hypothetical protein
MPLPLSGPLSLSQIAAEFGGATPHSLSEYYAGGPYVNSGSAGINGPIPSSGEIKISDFYGASNLPAGYTGMGVISGIMGRGESTDAILEGSYPYGWTRVRTSNIYYGTLNPPVTDGYTPGMHIDAAVCILDRDVINEIAYAYMMVLIAETSPYGYTPWTNGKSIRMLWTDLQDRQGGTGYTYDHTFNYGDPNIGVEEVFDLYGPKHWVRQYLEYEPAKDPGDVIYECFYEGAPFTLTVYAQWPS